MTRLLLAVCVFGLITSEMDAGFGPLEPLASSVDRAFRAHVVVFGKVTTIEKDTIDVPVSSGKDKVSYKVAVVKIETNLAGADNLTHLKVTFIPGGANPFGGDPKRRPRLPLPEVEQGEEYLLFLTKDTNTNCYAMPPMIPPINSKNANFKAELESVTKMLAIADNPAKALKAEKAEDRYANAVVIIYRCRVGPEPGTKTESVPLDAEDSRAILKALGEQKWQDTIGKERFTGYGAFSMLGLTDKDGWTAPKIDPSKNFFEQMREAYNVWLAGPGKDYRIKKLVPKTGK